MLQALYFDNLINLLKEKFQQVTDSRSAVNSAKPLSDALMSGLALFALRVRSLLQFIERLKERSSNLRRIFKIGMIISDTAMRLIIGPVAPVEVKAILHQPVSPQAK